MEDVGLITQTAMDAAYKLRSTEVRARALVDSAVAHSMRNRGGPDEQDFERYAYEIATNATTLLMQQIYEGDAELFALRKERDHYKALAERFINLTPPAPIILKTEPTS